MPENTELNHHRFLIALLLQQLSCSLPLHTVFTAFAHNYPHPGYHQYTFSNSSPVQAQSRYRRDLLQALSCTCRALPCCTAPAPASPVHLLRAIPPLKFCCCRDPSSIPKFCAHNRSGQLSSSFTPQVPLTETVQELHFGGTQFEVRKTCFRVVVVVGCWLLVSTKSRDRRNSRSLSCQLDIDILIIAKPANVVESVVVLFQFENKVYYSSLFPSSQSHFTFSLHKCSSHFSPAHFMHFTSLHTHT